MQRAASGLRPPSRARAGRERDGPNVPRSRGQPGLILCGRSLPLGRLPKSPAGPARRAGLVREASARTAVRHGPPTLRAAVGLVHSPAPCALLLTSPPCSAHQSPLQSPASCSLLRSYLDVLAWTRPWSAPPATSTCSCYTRVDPSLQLRP